jgi:tRNA-dihydrouridine synthase B
MVEDAGAAAVTIHGRTAEQSYSGSADWDLVARVAADLRIPVFGSGDCLEPEQIVRRMEAGVSGVLVGRGVLRNPWVLSQADDIAQGRPAREVSLEQRGQFLMEYIDLLIHERLDEADGFRHVAPAAAGPPAVAGAGQAVARGRERWVINKIRALSSWYSKGFEHGSHFRVAVNRADSIERLRGIVGEFFFAPAAAGVR